MRIEIDRVDDAFHFEAKNENGRSIHMDGAPEIGGSNQGVRPMQALLMGMGGCSGIDVVLILKKLRQPLDDIRIIIEADRKKVGDASIFGNIHVHFDLKGDLDESKVKRAVDLSMEKYCSATRILEATATITHSFAVNAEQEGQAAP